MSSTLNKQRGRSTRCAEKSKRIEYHGEKDFWAFYLANKAQIDHIIEVQAKKFAWYIETPEMIQEVLIRLHDSNVLGKYNPKKSAISSHIYGHISGYVNHVAREYSRQWQPCSKVVPGGKLQSDVHNRVFFSEFNGLNDAYAQQYTQDNLQHRCPANRQWSALLSCVTEEQEIDANFLREELARGLRPISRKVLDYCLQGYNCSGIAKKLGCTISSVSLKMEKIRLRLEKLLMR